MRALAILTAALSATPAWADVAARAQAQRITIELIDLDPADGIDAALTLAPEWAENGGLHYGLVHLQTLAYERQLLDAPFQPTDLSFVDRFGETSALIGADDSGASVGSTGRSATPGGRFDAYALGISADFSLTPRTALLLHGDYRLEASKDGGCAAPACEWAQAQVYAELFMDDGATVGDRQWLSLGDGGAPDSFATRSGTFAVRWDNLGAGFAGGRMSLYAEAAGAIPVSAQPVPEPARGLLAALGLLVLGAWRRART